MKRCLLFLFILVAYFFTYSQGGTWTWVKGSSFSGSSGSYGTKGVPSVTNEPPARYQCAYWTDKNGNFWIFGGASQGGTLTDMWKYNVATNMWTWVSGVWSLDNDGNYGTKGVPSVNNYPCSRTYGANCWTDTAGMLWLFGGRYNSLYLNDLWKYNPNTNEWTWVHGDNLTNSSFTYIPPNYGVKNIPSVSNTPGSREECKSGWCINNKLYLFGGTNSLNNYKNDLWEYNISTNLWTWIGGENTSNSSGVYGALNVASISNSPPARMSYTKWKKGTKIYLFAGGRFNNSDLDGRNDVWIFDIKTNLWTWVNGSNSYNNLGINSTSTCENLSTIYPATRIENQTVQNSSCSNGYWTYGGRNVDNELFSDLWLYKLELNEWVRVSGTTSMDFSGNYGTKGVPNSSNLPPGKGGVAIWTDLNDNLFVFGGLIKNNTLVDYSNDLWKFTPDTSCFNYNLTQKIINNPTKSVYCGAESVVLTLNSIMDSVRVTPNTNVSFNSDSTILSFNPTATTTYKVLAHGSYCNSFKDSLIFTLNVGAKTTSSITKSICSNETFLGRNTSGTYIDTLINNSGCDSIRTLYLTVKPISNTTINKSICKGESFLGRTSSGTYYETYTNSSGCDSVQKLILVVSKYITNTIDTTICENQDVSGYNISGVYADTFKRATTCDSIRNLKLTVIPKNHPTIIKKICEGKTILEGYTQTGVYIDVFKNINGCDSIRKLDLTVIPTIRKNLTNTICSGKNLYGYNKTGIYIDTFKSSSGCDSIRTLDLTVTPKVIHRIYTCINPGQVIYFMSKIITKEGIYIDSISRPNDCDSIFINTVKLIIPITSTKTKEYVACKYLSLNNGKYFLKDSTFQDTILSVQGCDSIYTLSHVTIKTISYPEAIKFDFCDTFRYKNIVYYKPLSFIDTIKTKEPPYCDSIHKKIIYNQLPKPDVSIISPSGNIITRGESILLNALGASSYKWSTNETISSIYVKPTTYSTYYVTGWNIYHCEDTASISIEVEDPVEFDLPIAFSPNGDGINDYYYPNTSGKYEILLFEIFNRWGEKMFVGTTKDNAWNGMYKGVMQSPDIFVFHIVYKKNRKVFERRGSVTLVR